MNSPSADHLDVAATDTNIGSSDPTLLDSLRVKGKAMLHLQAEKIISRLEGSKVQSFKLTSSTFSFDFTREVLNELNGTRLKDGRVIRTSPDGTIKLEKAPDLKKLLDSEKDHLVIAESLKSAIRASVKGADFLLKVPSSLAEGQIKTLQMALSALSSEVDLTTIRIQGKSALLHTHFDGLPSREGVLRYSSAGRFQLRKRYEIGLFSERDTDFQEDLRKIYRAAQINFSGAALQVWIPSGINYSRLPAVGKLARLVRNKDMNVEFYTGKKAASDMPGFIPARDVIRFEKFPASAGKEQKRAQELSEMKKVVFALLPLGGQLLRRFSPPRRVAVWLQRADISKDQKKLLKELSQGYPELTYIASPEVRSSNSELFAPPKKGIFSRLSSVFTPGRR